MTSAELNSPHPCLGFACCFIGLCLVLSCPGCPAEVSSQECRNPYKVFQGCMRLLTLDSRAVDLMAVQQRLLGNYSHLQIDMCGIIDRSDIKHHLIDINPGEVDLMVMIFMLFFYLIYLHKICFVHI